MGFKCGIVGLPNVGKSTLFNALTRTAAAQAANFPFCTIEPNVGEVSVPDERLDTLAKIAGSKEIIPTRLTFVDIAGLVKGASKGEGLGNQFLANIRETDAIAHVLRCFEDDDITHVDGRINPLEDAETIETELMLADLESIEKRISGLVRKIKGNDKEAVLQNRLLHEAKAALEEGRPARTVEVSAEDQKQWEMLQLLTSKPVLFVCNVAETDAAEGNEWSAKVAEMAAAQGAGHVVISAAIEEELAAYNPLIPDGSNWKATFMLEFPDPEERQERLAQMLGIEDRVWLQVEDCERVFAIADEDLDRANADKTSSVHFLRFELTPSMAQAVQHGADVGAGIDHPAYPVDYQTGAFSDDIGWGLSGHLDGFNTAIREWVGLLVYDLTGR